MDQQPELIARAYDLAMLQTAANYDLTSKEDRAASNRWLVDLFSLLLAKATRPEVVLELGAFSAAFSCNLRPRLPDALFHAFEANPHNYERFRPGVEAAGVGYHHLAVGEAERMVSFNLAKKRDGQDVSATRGSHSIRTKPLDIEYEEIPVQMISVDHFVERHGLAGKPTALWIDVEGYAYEALSGAAQTLKDTQLIFVEVEDHPFWIGQKLSGEVRAHLVGAGFIPLARDFETKWQYNVIFAKPDVCDRADVRHLLTSSFSRAGKRARTGSAAPI